MTLLTRSDLPLPLVGRGKVRDIYAVGEDRLLLIATDRVSAFDVVMAEPVPHKGAVLTQLSAWWFRRLPVEHHMLSVDADEIIAAVPAVAAHRDQIEGRATLCRRVAVVPIECVVRGYLSGSAWKEYAATGTLAGEPLPAGLRQSERLDPPVFSPATKAETGHDENIPVSRMAELIGEPLARELERRAREVYEAGRAAAAERGLVLADTKFEFGQDADGRVVLIDEVMTPDSSRYWPAGGWSVGEVPPSFDKQPLRDYLDGERAAGRWNGEAPPPPLPQAVIDAMSARYLDLYRRMTGEELAV
ncbi:MAG TPA: phosphoribosylaminoimidazolesuccinocarboxamide synthase [Caulobacter sp.]|nr:phosphoribosylaminoimidazolesuccinocarboxamide synthase [Caulobacter sp.]